MKYLINTMKIGASAMLILIITLFASLMWIDVMKMFLTEPIHIWLLVVAVYAVPTWLLWRLCKWLGGVIKRNTQRERDLGERLGKKLTGSGVDKSLMITLVLLATLPQTLPAMAQDENLLKQEIYNHVVVPCTLAWAKGDTALADNMLAVPAVKQAMSQTVDAIYVMAQHTSDADVRKRGYPLWVNQCVAGLK